MEPIFDPQIALILWLQSLGDWLVEPMKFFTMLGNEEFYLVAAPIFYWCIDARLGLRMGLLLMISDSLNNLVKVLSHTPRPYWVNTRVSALSAETSFGVPSGHSQNAASLWGMLAAALKGWGAWVAAVALIFLIGLSRMVLGVHFPVDVLSGWLLGALVLAGFLLLERHVAAWLRRIPWAAQALAAFGASLAMIGLGILARLSLGGWKAPVEWIENARAATGIAEPINPLAFSGLVSDAGAFFGLAVGAIFIANAGGYDAGGALWKRALRFLAGLVGVLILWRGLGAVLPRGEEILPLVLRWVRYVLVGLWVTGLAPVLFLRLGLAETTAGGRRQTAEGTRLPVGR